MPAAPPTRRPWTKRSTPSPSSSQPTRCRPSWKPLVGYLALTIIFVSLLVLGCCIAGVGVTGRDLTEQTLSTLEGAILALEAPPAAPPPPPPPMALDSGPPPDNSVVILPFLVSLLLEALPEQHHSDPWQAHHHRHLPLQVGPGSNPRRNEAPPPLPLPLNQSVVAYSTVCCYSIAPLDLTDTRLRCPASTPATPGHGGPAPAARHARLWHARHPSAQAHQSINQDAGFPLDQGVYQLALCTSHALVCCIVLLWCSPTGGSVLHITRYKV